MIGHQQRSLDLHLLLKDAIEDMTAKNGNMLKTMRDFVNL